MPDGKLMGITLPTLGALLAILESAFAAELLVKTA